jgi:penicillin-binding protein 1A
VRIVIAKYILKFTAVIVAMATVVGVASAALTVPIGLLGDVGSGKPDNARLELSTLAQRSYVYASDGTLLATLHDEENRQPIALIDVPQHAIDAILAVEDAGFWIHDGVNARGMLRAFTANIDAGGISQGGSTITQQVVKLDLLTSKKTLDRKSQEIVLALRLEKQMPKRRILERYLNTVYFGNHAYGIQAAAESYFGKSAKDLTVDEAAMLAGMIRNPNIYNPIKYPERVKDRRDVALERMVDVGAITEDEATWYGATAIPTEVKQVLPQPDDYFVAEVRTKLLADKKLGATYEERKRKVFQGGLKVYTTFDPKAQAQAVTARDSRLPLNNGVFAAGTDPETGEPRFGSAAIVSIEPATGAVRTMVGGPGFQNYQFNLALGRRNPGSSFKTFVLATLMSQGRSPNDFVDGRGPCKFNNPPATKPYDVQNFDGASGGPDTVRGQTLRSSNCAYVRLGLIAGVPNVIAMADHLGVDSPMEPNISSSLGTVDVSPMDMASAYATIANDGVFNTPYMIDKVVDRDGTVLTQHTARPTQVLDPEAARLVTSVLQDNIRSGTGKAAAIGGGNPAGGKTGTHQGSYDAWFVGYSMDLATAVWVGGLGSQFTIVLGGRQITGGSYPAQIWGDYMTAYHQGRPARAFPAAPNRPGTLLAPPAGSDLTPPPPPPPPPVVPPGTPIPIFPPIGQPGQPGQPTIPGFPGNAPVTVVPRPR